MKNYFFILCFLLSATASAQVDSVIQSVDSTRANWSSKVKHWKDSIQKVSSTQWLKDSLTLEAWSAQMKSKIQTGFDADSLTIKSQIDSLQSLNLPTSHLNNKLDSLVSSRQGKFQEVQTKQQALLQQSNERLATWQQKVTSRLDSLGLKQSLPTAAVPSMEEVNLPQVNIPEMPTLNAQDFTQLELSPELAVLNKELPFSSVEGLSNFQHSLEGMPQWKGLMNSGIEELKANPEQLVEGALGKVEGVGELQKLKEVQNPLGDVNLQNPTEVKEEIKKQAIDHFAGKEAALKEAMNKLSVYKKKYSEVASLKDLPKKPHNEMRDKKFIERVVEGIAWQLFKDDRWMMDMNPYLGYRFTTRVTVGAGWNHRVVFGEKAGIKEKVYGPRLYGEYTIVKGFGVRLEVETMNTFVKDNFKSETGKREWVPTALIGLKKTYKIHGRLRGTVITLYNLYNPNYESPYGDRLNLRFGVEYTIKK